MKRKKLDSIRGVHLRAVMTIVVVLGLMMLAPMVAQAGSNPNPGVLPVDAKPYGMTYGEWSAEWWKYVLSIPTDINPLFDTEDADCRAGQSGKVWFLVGSWVGTVTRTCTIPANKAIFLPIINVECSTVELDPFYCTNEEECRACADEFADGIGKNTLKATIDGVHVRALNTFRVQSPYFDFTLPVDNILGVDAGEGSSVSDGYWLMLNPLPKGEHEIHFEGAFVKGPGEGTSQDVTYILTVT